jgi:hypothetical protein
MDMGPPLTSRFVSCLHILLPSKSAEEEGEEEEDEAFPGLETLKQEA